MKNNEYKSQTKKMIPIAVSTISQFWYISNFFRIL